MPGGEAVQSAPSALTFPEGAPVNRQGLPGGIPLEDYSAGGTLAQAWPRRKKWARRVNGGGVK